MFPEFGDFQDLSCVILLTQNGELFVAFVQSLALSPCFVNNSEKVFQRPVKKNEKDI